MVIHNGHVDSSAETPIILLSALGAVEIDGLPSFSANRRAMCALHRPVEVKALELEIDLRCS